MLKDKKILLIAFITYFLATGVSYVAFAYTPLGQRFASPVPPPSKSANGELMFDESLPKTEACPINGLKYSKQQKEWWEKQRPLGVMIENHESARPQSGINSADITYEIIAEGGITRTLNVFYCQTPAQVGPIRSARTYFLDFMSEYGDSPLYAHVGGANTPGPADALGQISDYGWAGYNDLNQFSIGFPTFWRDYNRLGHTTATEHTMYSTTDKLWEFADEDRGLSSESEDGVAWDKGFEPYSFKEDGKPASSQTVHIEHWEGYDEYSVDWTFDPKTNTYSRKNGGKVHLDRNTNKPIVARNIVVLYMSESNANDGYENNAHLLYDTKGTGDAVVFIDGKKISGQWSKDSRTDKTVLTDSSGDEIEFNRGKIWFHVIDESAGVLTVK